MTTSELRVGNKIMWFNTVSTVAAILNYEFIRCENFDSARKIGEFSPIELKREIFISLGFIVSDAEIDLLEYTKGDISIKNDGGLNEEHSNPYYFEYGDRCQKRQLKYLHELQNLYFSITGEELPFAQVSDTTMSN